MPATSTGPASCPSRRAAGCARSAGTQPRSTSSAAPPAAAAASALVAERPSIRSRRTAARGRAGRRPGPDPAKLPRRPVGRRRQGLGRGRELRPRSAISASFQRSRSTCQVPRLTSTRRPKKAATVGQSPGAKRRAAAAACGARPTAMSGESASRRTSGGLCWSAFASECSPARWSIEGRARGTHSHGRTGGGTIRKGPKR